MISSEVQRTLVKSPPELWAEISDPAALARHLGEFGEIRITRIEPEQRVEWQAEDASGSVVIKPSGWGTKVKLTVSRQLADGASVAEPASDVEPAGEAEPASVAEPVSDAEPVIASQPPIDAEPFVDAQRASGAELIVEARRAMDAELLFDAQPAPDGAPAIEAELATQADTDVQARPTAPPSDDADELASLQREPVGYEPVGQAAEPRRGFLARLFGRRRRSAAQPVADPTVELEPAREPGKAVRDEPYNALAVWAAQADAEGTQPAAPVKPAAVAQITETQGAHGAVTREDALGRIGSRLQPRQPACGPSELASSAARERAQAASAAADEPGEEDAQEAVSKEMAAAEEIATEQATEVLSGVLDRLGAAHHRPFSRA